MYSKHLHSDIASIRSGRLIAPDFACEIVAAASSHRTELARLVYSLPTGKSPEFAGRLLADAAAAKDNLYNRTVFAIAPLYVTSICQERCLYCNFRAENKGVEVERLRLTPAQLQAEMEFLVHQKGLRVLELVYATDPNVRIDTICQHVSMARKLLESVGGGTVGINAEQFDVDDYRRLIDAGLDFAVLWQETYDPLRYKELHPGRTKKADMAYRLDGFERMHKAGLRSFGMGVLSGLSDWRFDWAMLVKHGDYLRDTIGIGPAILGVPRLKPALGAKIQTTEWIPSDEQMRTLVALHNLFRPETMPFINTRESWENCLAMAEGGGCLFTFNCSTIPGGYSLGSHGYQFPTGSYDATDYAPKVEAAGLKVDFDWQPQLPVRKIAPNLNPTRKPNMQLSDARSPLSPRFAPV